MTDPFLPGPENTLSTCGKRNTQHDQTHLANYKGKDQQILIIKGFYPPVTLPHVGPGLCLPYFPMTRWDRQGPYPISQMKKQRQRESAGPSPLGPRTLVLHVLHFLGSRVHWLPAGFSQWEGLAEAWRVAGSEKPHGCGVFPSRQAIIIPPPAK